MDIPLMPSELDQIKDAPIRRAMVSVWQHLARSINGRLYVGDAQSQLKKQTGNIDGVFPNPNNALVGGYPITTPGVANTEFTVTHNLGRIPAGYDVKAIDQAAIIYDSRRNNWTKTQMFLKANAASVNITLFVH